MRILKYKNIVLFKQKKMNYPGINLELIKKFNRLKSKAKTNHKFKVSKFIDINILKYIKKDNSYLGDVSIFCDYIINLTLNDLPFNDINKN